MSDSLQSPKNNLSVLDKIIESIESGWDRFVSAMSLSRQPTTGTGYMDVIDITEWTDGLFGSRARDLIGFDGQDFRLGTEAQWPDGTKEDFWGDAKFKSEADVRSHLAAQNAAEAVSITTPEVREDRATEVVRLYSESIKNSVQASPTVPRIEKPMDLESYRQERIFYGKHSMTETRQETTPVPSPQGDLFAKGEHGRVDRQHISQADRDASRAAVSSNTPTMSTDHMAQRRLELPSNGLEV